MDDDKGGNVIGIEMLDVNEYLTLDEPVTVKFDVSRVVAHRWMVYNSELGDKEGL